MDVPDIHVDAENVLERLEHFQAALKDATIPAGERAIALAWVLHLVGDVHQPLHASSRVTAKEPKGDGGGNAFKLDKADQDLHHYWDTMPDKAVVKRKRESERAYLSRAARLVVTRYPRADLEAELKLSSARRN